MRCMFLSSIGGQSVCQWSGRPGFNPQSSHTKVSKMVLDASLLNTQHYNVWIKGKWRNPGKGVALSLTPWCSSYWKRSLRFALDYSWPTTGDTQVSKRFCNILEAPDAFVKVPKNTNYTELWDIKLAWYFPSATHWICFYDLEHSFRPIWPRLIIKVL